MYSVVYQKRGQNVVVRGSKEKKIIKNKQIIIRHRQFAVLGIGVLKRGQTHFFTGCSSGFQK